MPSKSARNPWKKPHSVGFLSRELHPAREPVHYFAAVPPVHGPYKLDWLATAQIRSARKAENRSFFLNAKKMRFFRGGKRCLSNFVGEIDLQSVAFVQALIERHLGLESLEQLRTFAHGNVRALDAKRNGIGEPHAPKH